MTLQAAWGTRSVGPPILNFLLLFYENATLIFPLESLNTLSDYRIPVLYCFADNSPTLDCVATEEGRARERKAGEEEADLTLEGREGNLLLSPALVSFLQLT